MVKDILRRIEFHPYRPHCGPVFRLWTWDTHRTSYGKAVIGYCLKMYPAGLKTDGSAKGVTLFRGEDFGASPCHSIDGPDAIAGLMSFLTLRPGDTDAEYFADYTERQLAYCGQHAEALSAEVEARFGPR